MDEYKNITRKDIEEKLVGENLKVNRIISLALCIGPTLFLLVVIFLYQSKLSSETEILPDNIVYELVIALSVLAFGIYSFYFLFPKFYLKRENIIMRLSSPSVGTNNKNINDPVLSLIGLDRTVMIIRLAMLEGITLFGLVALIQSVLSGIIYYNSNYWLLTIPLILLVFVVFTNYLPKEKIISRIENDILFVLQKH